MKIGSFVWTAILSIVVIACLLFGIREVVLLYAAWCLIRLILRNLKGERESAVTTIAAAAIGLIIALIIGESVLFGICAGICVEDAIMSVLTLFVVVKSTKK